MLNTVRSVAALLCPVVFFQCVVSDDLTESATYSALAPEERELAHYEGLRDEIYVLRAFRELVSTSACTVTVKGDGLDKSYDLSAEYISPGGLSRMEMFSRSSAPTAGELMGFGFQVGMAGDSKKQTPARLTFMAGEGFMHEVATGPQRMLMPRMETAGQAADDHPTGRPITLKIESTKTENVFTLSCTPREQPLAATELEALSREISTRELRLAAIQPTYDFFGARDCQVTVGQTVVALRPEHVRDNGIVVGKNRNQGDMSIGHRSLADGRKKANPWFEYEFQLLVDGSQLSFEVFENGPEITGFVDGSLVKRRQVVVTIAEGAVEARIDSQVGGPAYQLSCVDRAP